MTQPPEFQPPVPPPPPAAPAQSYGQQVPMVPQTDGYAIASLCCSLSILVISCLGIVTSILAIVFARKAEQRIAVSGAQGAGLAKAGKIIGWVGIGLWVGGVLFYVLFFAVAIMNSDSNTSMALLP